MVYQTEAPPVPTRIEEKLMIEKIKKSMQDQPYYKYYMNEGIRLSKMDLADEINNYRKDWRGNLLRGMLIGTLVWTPIGLSMFRYSAYGVPAFTPPGQYEMPYFRGFNATRNRKQMAFILAAIWCTGYVYAARRTSVAPLVDEYFLKRKLRLPY